MKLRAAVLEMYSIYAGDILVGHSAFETGDPPMGVASGVFQPNPNFSGLHARGVPAVDGAGQPLADLLVWTGLSAKTPAGADLECQGGVCITGYCSDPELWELEVSCLGIPHPLYEDIFPEHVKSYESMFR
jgi:hypothetical protein